MSFIKPKVGRPPQRVDPNKKTTLTLRIPGHLKNLMIEQADAFDMTITEYLTALVVRDSTSA